MNDQEHHGPRRPFEVTVANRALKFTLRLGSLFPQDKVESGEISHGHEHNVTRHLVFLGGTVLDLPLARPLVDDTTRALEGVEFHSEGRDDFKNARTVGRNLEPGELSSK